MKRAIRFLSVVAVAALSIGPAQTGGATNATIVLANYNSTDMADLQATAGGGLWLDSGNGPALLPITQDINMDIQVRLTTTSAWEDVAAFSLSNHVIAGGPYPGNKAYDGMFYADGGQPVDIPGSTAAGPYEFQIFAWTGSYVNPGVNYSSYSAAQSGTAMVGQSGIFSEQAAPVGGVDFNTSYNMGFLDMPAIDMRPSLQGDCNLDGRVDINDLTIVLSHYGLADMTWKTGDLIGDGTVDINDLTIVLAHYGHTAGSAGAGGSASAVPEPSALALLAVAFLAPLSYACRPRRSRLPGGTSE